MPKIPVSSRQVRETVSSTPLARATAPATTGFTPGSAQQLGGIVGQVADIADQELQKVEQVELEAIATQFRDENSRLMHDKEAGFSNIRGKDTAESIDRYREDYGKFIDEKVKGLGSEFLRNKASSISGRFKSDFDLQLNRHTAREMERYEDNQFQANLESIQNHAALNYEEMGLNASKAGEAVISQAAHIEAYGQRKGLPREQINNLKLEASSKLHETVISRAVNNGQDKLARDYFDGVKERKQADADTINRVEKLLKVSATVGESQRIVDKVLSQKLSPSESVAMARKMAGDDEKLRDAAASRMKARIQEEKTLKTLDLQFKTESVVKDIEAKGSIDDIPKEMRAEWSESQRKNFEKLHVLVAGGGKVITDPLVRQELETMASNPVTRNKFLTTNISDLAHKLSTQDREELIKMQSRLRAGDAKADKAAKRFMTNNQIMEEKLAQMKITNREKKAEFKELVRQRSLQWMEDNGKKFIPEKEVDRIANEVSRPVIVEDAGWFWFDAPVPSFQVKPGDKVVGIPFENIPPRDLELMRMAYKKRNRLHEFTQERAEKDYARFLARTNR